MTSDQLVSIKAIIASAIIYSILLWVKLSVAWVSRARSPLLMIWAGPREKCMQLREVIHKVTWPPLR